MKKKKQKLTIVKLRRIKTRSIVLVLVLVVTLPLIVLVMQQKQNESSNAWNINSSAASVCSSTGTARIKISFTNTETDPPLGMQVTVLDIQTGASTDLGVVQPGETRTGQIATGKTMLMKNSVLFELHRINKNADTDTASAAYNAISCSSSTTVLTPTAH